MEGEEDTLEMLEMLKEEERFQETCNSFVAAVVSWFALDQIELEDGSKGRTSGSKNVKRERVPVETIFACLGLRLFKKCYRMPETLFGSSMVC